MSRSWDRLLSVVASFRFRVRAAIERPQRDRDLDDELQHHLALRAEREAELGLSAPAARRAAILRFGSLSRIHDETRDASRFVVLAEFIDDAAHGGRLLGRSPVFACVTVMILSLGIGINAWIFSAMTALLFRPVPGVAEPNRLVAIGRTQNGTGFDTQSFPNAIALRERNTVLSGLAVYSDITVAVDAHDQTARLRGQLVSANFFRLIGSPMTQGRGFSDPEDRPGAYVAVVSDEFWRRTFGEGSLATDVAIRVNRAPVRIVGVAPPGFRGLAAGAPVDVWLPIGAMHASQGPSILDDPLTNRAATWLWAVGRLNPDVTVGQARASLRSLGAQLAAEFPDDNDGRGVAVEPIGGLGPTARERLMQQWTLLNGLSAVVLLVVCFNVANMMLARASSRAQEMAVRLSLGAGRIRLVRQLLAEHVVLAMAGGVGGGLIAWWASRMLQSAQPPGFLSLPAGSLDPDWRVFAFTAAIALASSAVFSLPPAWTAARMPIVNLLRSGTGHRVSQPARLRTVFAVLQVALSLALLIGASLLGRSLQKATEVDLGFQAGGVVTAYYDLEAAGYTPADGAQVHARLLEQMRRWSAIDAAALGQHAPLQGSSLGLPIEIVSRGSAGGGRSLLVRMNVITPDFFHTLRTPILRGREFRDDEVAAAPPVALVNETCRRQCFGGEDPIGRRILVFRETSPREVVGVVADSKYSQPLEDVRPTVYVPAAQRYSPRMALLLRTSSPAAVVRALPGEVRRVDAALPIYDALTLDDRLSVALWPSRLISALVGGFSLLTLVLAVLGVYGVVAQATDQRAPEIAVRMALGAGPGTILRMVVRHGLALVTIGMALGVSLALALSGLLESFLYGIEPIDPVSFGLAILVLAGFALGACLLPARRAAAASPGCVLRR